jgi:hypothetical protein
VEEMKKCIIIAFLIAILIGFAIDHSYFSIKGQPKSWNNVQSHPKESAYSYLVNSYNSSLGLCYENPEAKNVYWVTHDNVLASYVLQQWNREIADNITETIKRIARDYNLTTSSIGIPLDTRAEVLLGYNVKNFNKTENITLNASYYGSILKTERATNEILSVQVLENYTDLLCYASLVEWRKENYSRADYYYEKAKSMWDGNGFRDAAFTNNYSTYKLGLFYFLNKMTRNGSFVFERQLIERVWQCQDSNGGFKTDYYGNGSFPVCQTNTETTSIILLSGIPYSLEYEENVRVGAYYYIWWGIPFNNHWNENIKNTPFLGKYNSNDSTIADKHILLAKQHGVDFFAVSWMGKGTWIDWDFDDIDRNLQSGLLNATHIQNFNFCLFYETQIVLNASIQGHKNFTEIFLNDMIYAAQHYFNHPSYLHIDDKPVLFIYDLPYLYRYSPIPAHELLEQARQQLANLGSDAYFVGDVGGGPSPSDVDLTWLYSMNATTSYFFSNPSKGWNEILEDARTCYPEWRNVTNSRGIKFIPDAYSGFNNTGLTGVVEPTVLPNNATMFREMLKIAINDADSDLKIVMITSWNEWLESTAIEPSMEFGELFLHTVYDVVPEFPSSTFLLLFMILAMLVVIYIKKKSPKPKINVINKTNAILAYAR